MQQPCCAPGPPCMHRASKGTPRTIMPSGFPFGRPFKAGRAGGGPGPHCSRAGRLAQTPPADRRPVGSTTPERLPPDGLLVAPLA